MSTSQGSHYHRMDKQLYDEENVFPSHINRCNKTSETIKDKEHDLLGLMFSSSEDYLARSDIPQLVLVALEWSLTRILQDAGV